MRNTERCGVRPDDVGTQPSAAAACGGRLAVMGARFSQHRVVAIDDRKALLPV
jgi:hypothetical protein